MTEQDFKDLSTGDVISSNTTGVRYVVAANYGDRVTAIASVDVTNPIEFSLQAKAKYPVHERGKE